MNPLHFVCVGPQRTASSWLYEVLRHQHGIKLPEKVKETMFFDQRFQLGNAWYWSHFGRLAEGDLVGEIAPTYFHSPQAASRLFEVNPNMKVIVGVRNPIEKTYSLYRHDLSKGRFSGSFADALKTNKNLVDTGRYATHIPLWEKYFGCDNVLMVLQEDIQQQPETLLKELSTFLGVTLNCNTERLNTRVNSAGAPRSRHLAKVASTLTTKLRKQRLHWIVEAAKAMGLKRIYKGGAAPPSMTSLDRHKLQGIFQNDIQWLQNRLDRDLSSWIKSD